MNHTLADADQTIPIELETGLRRRGFELHTVRDEPTVMLTLAEQKCHAVIAVIPPAPRSPTTPTPNPTSQQVPAALFHAIERDYPHVKQWTYDPSPMGHGLVSYNPSPSHNGNGNGNGKHHTTQSPQQPTPSPMRRPFDTASVTPEEIAMLLDPPHTLTSPHTPNATPDTIMHTGSPNARHHAPPPITTPLTTPTTTPHPTPTNPTPHPPTHTTSQTILTDSDPLSNHPFPFDPAALGDTDLIDQLMLDHHQMPAMALAIIQSQGHIPHVDICNTDAQNTIPTDHVQTPITYRNRNLGILHAPPPTNHDKLMSWAAWLARWLALDHRMTALWDMAQHDPLTGLWNRRYFSHFLKTILARASAERFQVTLMVFDIDDFKHYNDNYGHPAGDEILKEASSLLRSVVREHDVVARIGGDEFAVIFWDPQGPRQPHSTHPTDVRQAAERFRRAICEHKFPKLSAQAPGNLTISGGLASFPWDGRDPEHLIEQADKMASQSKQQGKNALAFGPGALRGCESPESP